MHNALVTSLWLNKDFVIAQVDANVTDAKN